MGKLSENAEHRDLKIELLVIFAILISLGFPGNYAWVWGSKSGIMMGYAAFFIEIFAMVLSSGENWLSVQVVSLDKKYSMLYILAVVLLVESMLVTNAPSLQFITSIRLCVTLLFAIWMQEYFSFRRMVEMICIAQTIFVLLVLVFMLRYPWMAFEDNGAFIGLYPSKNSFASELSFGIACMAFLIREKRKKFENFKGWMLVLVVQIIMVLMCRATGAQIGLVLILALFFVPTDVRIPLGWGYITGNIGFLFGTLTIMPYFEWFFELIGKDATLTGRIPLWNQIISVMMTHNTFTGYGYGMFWRDSQAVALIHAGFDENSFMGTMTTGAHNMLLEFWLNSGLIGLAVLFAAILFSMKRIKEIEAEKYVFSSLVMGYLMINGLTERCLGGNYDYKMLGLFLVMALCCNRAVPPNNHVQSKTEEES